MPVTKPAAVSSSLGMDKAFKRLPSIFQRPKLLLRYLQIPLENRLHSIIDCVLKALIRLRKSTIAAKQDHDELMVVQLWQRDSP